MEDNNENKQNLNTKSTHLVFDGQKIIISPDIQHVFIFLMEIEKEIESILGFNEKLNSIKESYLEMIKIVQFLSNKLIENKIDFNYDLSEPQDKIVEKLKFHIPLRSEMIVLFASLDVLFNLHTAYKNETFDQDVLRKLTMDNDNTKKFLNEFILNLENTYYKNNIKRLSKIDSTKLRNLRNSLTHFFSIGHGGLSLAPSLIKERSREFEEILKQNKKGNVVFISEDDLFNLIKQANILRLKKWSDDYLNNPGNFKKKMRFVIDLVHNEAAFIVKNK